MLALCVFRAALVGCLPPPTLSVFVPPPSAVQNIRLLHNSQVQPTCGLSYPPGSLLRAQQSQTKQLLTLCQLLNLYTRGSHRGLGNWKKDYLTEASRCTALALELAQFSKS